jgi:hypothetical protein
MTNWQTFFYLVGVVTIATKVTRAFGIPCLWWSTKRGFYWE